MRERELTIQFQLTLERTLSIKVFIPNYDFQVAIGKLYDDYVWYLQASNKSYADAAKLFESVSGLDSLNVSPRLFFTRSVKDVFAVDRLDAEYACVPDLLSVWNPHCPVRSLGEISDSVSNGITPAKSEYGPEGIPIIKVGDLTNYGVAEFGGTFVTPGTKSLRSNKGSIKPGDVLVLAAAHHIRYIGKPGLFEAWSDAQKKCQCVGELIAVRPGPELSGEVLICYLNATAIRTQVQKLVRGISAHLYPIDLKTLPVPIIDKDNQYQIEAKIHESFEARRKATQLLDEAKILIEQAIY